jgi:uncharacterized membrane protein
MNTIILILAGIIFAVIGVGLGYIPIWVVVVVAVLLILVWWFFGRGDDEIEYRRVIRYKRT